MCVIVNTSEFVPALIDCVYKNNRKTTDFIISEEVMWRVVKELQTRCWSNVYIDYKERNTVVASLNYVFGENFVSIGDKNEIKVRGANDAIRRTMASYFYSEETTWYKELGKISINCLSIVNGSRVIFSQPGKRDGYNIPKDALNALDLVYPEHLLSALSE